MPKTIIASANCKIGSNLQPWKNNIKPAMKLNIINVFMLALIFSFLDFLNTKNMPDEANNSIPKIDAQFKDAFTIFDLLNK